MHQVLMSGGTPEVHAHEEPVWALFVFRILMMTQKRRWVEDGSMESRESTPSLGRQPRNTFETRGNVANQAGEQNIYGNVVFQSV